jgi:TonB-linked SusC/RagA family outer membrane protein
MKQIVRLAAVLFGMMLCSQLYAQTHVVTGTVKDPDGKAIPFLAVTVKGTTIGTYTDTAGKFTLVVDQTAKTIVLSYPGMKTQEAAISDNMTVTMTSDALGLSEVVVGAVGISQEKKALGYATQVVGADQLDQSGTGNVMNELEGKVAGLSVVSSSGDPGAGTFMNLRGITSLTSDNQPLMVVDGIPIDNSINNFDPTGQGALAAGASGNLTGGTQPTNRGLDINPADIESVTVLKGPAATALYGIAAANGAIIITTKKGKKGGEGLGIEVYSSLSWSMVDKLPALQNDYAQGSVPDQTNYAGPGNEPTWYGPPTGAGRKFSWGPAISGLAWSGTGTNPWFQQGDSIVPKGTPGAGAAVSPFNPYNFFQTGVANDNNISFSNGTDRSSYRMSLGNLTQTGVIPGSDYRKTNFNINGQTSLSKRMSISGGINYVNSLTDKVQQGSNVSSVMLGLLRTPPTFDNSYGVSNYKDSTAYILPNGVQRDFRGGPGYDNPYWTVNRNPFTSSLNRVFGFGEADYDVTDWFHLTYRVGGDMYWQDDKNAYDIGSNAFPAGAIYVNDYFNSQFNSDLLATFSKKFSDNFSAKLIIGQNFFQQNASVRSTQGNGFVIPDFLDLSNATSFVSSESESEYRKSAVYGDLQLEYADQLFLTITGRDETSSTLPASSDNFFYPSASLGWVFTEPLHLSTNKVFPYGKLRVSYAQVGKDAPLEGLQNYYHSASIVDGFTTGITFPFNGLPGFQYGNPTFVLGNPNLKPETTNSFEVGADLAFFQNRLGISVTYYNETSSNVILQVPVPYSTGFGAELENAGELTNNGIEWTVNITPLKMKNGFTWDLTMNYSHNVNEVVKLAPGVQELFIAGFQGGAIEALPGQSFGQIYGTDYVHVNSNPNSALLINDVPGPGYGMPIPGSTSSALANTLPNWIGGLTNTFSFKGIILGISMSVREGGSIWDGTLGAMEYFGTAAQTDNRTGSQVFAGDLGHLDANGNVVHYTSPTTTAPNAGAANTEAAPTNQWYWQNVGNSFVGPTSASIYDGSYVRISQINLGYDLPHRLVQKAHFTKITFTLFATNPVLWTKYPGVDPETSLAGPANGQGLDYFNNPGAKSYGIRLNLGL